MNDQCNVESGDGFIHQIFKNLWKVDPVLKKTTCVNMPDTIIFQNGGIHQWYFSQENHVSCRKKQNLEKDNILKKFSSFESPSGIVAVWMYKQREPIPFQQSGEYNAFAPQNRKTKQDAINGSTDGNLSEQSSAQKQTKLIYQYMNLEELEQFLIDARPGEMIDGVLQKFVHPKGEYNSVITVTWTRQFCLCERVTSTRVINNKSLDIYQRVVTFEADQQAITQELKGEAMKTWIENKTTEIVTHIENTNEKPIQISLFKGIFKVDHSGKVQFLQCRTIQVNTKGQEMKPTKDPKSIPFISTYIPENINLHKTTMESKDLDLRLKITCYKCLNKVDKQSIFEVEYDSIIKSWQFDHVGEMEKIKEQSEQKYLEERERLEKLYILLDKLDLDMPEEFPKALDQDVKRFDIVPNYLIPRVIRNQEPELTEEQYILIQDNPGFRSRVSSLCENCCLHMMSSINWKDNQAKMKTKALNDRKYKGVGQLKPEIIISRYNKTRKQVELKKMFEEELNPNSKDKDLLQRIRRMERDISSNIQRRTDIPQNMQEIFNRIGMKANLRHEMYLEALGISIKQNNHMSRHSKDDLYFGKYDKKTQYTEDNRQTHLSSHIESSIVDTHNSSMHFKQNTIKENINQDKDSGDSLLGDQNIKINNKNNNTTIQMLPLQKIIGMSRTPAISKQRDSKTQLVNHLYSSFDASMQIYSKALKNCNLKKIFPQELGKQQNPKQDQQYQQNKNNNLDDHTSCSQKTETLSDGDKKQTGSCNKQVEVIQTGVSILAQTDRYFIQPQLFYDTIHESQSQQVPAPTPLKFFKPKTANSYTPMHAKEINWNSTNYLNPQTSYHKKRFKHLNKSATNQLLTDHSKSNLLNSHTNSTTELLPATTNSSYSVNPYLFNNSAQDSLHLRQRHQSSADLFTKGFNLTKTNQFVKPQYPQAHFSHAVDSKNCFQNYFPKQPMTTATTTMTVRSSNQQQSQQLQQQKQASSTTSSGCHSTLKRDSNCSSIISNQGNHYHKRQSVNSFPSQ